MEQAMLLRMVLSNCAIDATSLYPIHTERPLTESSEEQELRNGAPGTTRTCDLLVRSQTLYPTELREQILKN